MQGRSDGGPAHRHQASTHRLGQQDGDRLQRHAHTTAQGVLPSPDKHAMCCRHARCVAYLLVSAQADVVRHLQSASIRTHITICSILAMAWLDLNPECS